MEAPEPSSLYGAAAPASAFDFRAETASLQDVLARLGPEFYEALFKAARVLKEAFAREGKVLICGNGGSAAEAQHFSDEMVGRYASNRRAYPVLALTADSAILTCIGNDFGFDDIFARQVEAYGAAGDVLLGLSTSGNSRNVLKAAEAAKRRGMTVVALTGMQGELRQIADISLEVPGRATARVQEVHLHAIHLLSAFFEPSRSQAAS